MESASEQERRKRNRHSHPTDDFCTKQLGFTVPDEKPELPVLDASSSTDTLEPADEKTLRELHTLLLETEVREGKLVCGNCGHEYKIKEGIANFLLPSHLGEFELSPFS